MQSEQQQRIMGYFIEEAKDHLNTIEQGLLNLQSTIADPEMISEVFRAAHSVKGGAAMLGLDSIQQTSHRLEDYFKVLKECPVQVDQALESLFLRVFDTLQELLEQLQGPFGLTDDKSSEAMAEVEPVFNQLNEHLSRLVSQSGGVPPEEVNLSAKPAAAPTARPSAQPAPAGVPEESALQLFFQSDVPAQLRSMLQLFKQADSAKTRQSLQDICRSLSQAGDSFELPQGWSHLAEVARQAIASPDNNYRALAPVIIRDLKQAQELVLSGHPSEIVISEALAALRPAEPELTEAADDVLDDLGLDDLGITDLDLADTDSPDLDVAPMDDLFFGEESRQTADFGLSDALSELESPSVEVEETDDWFAADASAASTPDAIPDHASTSSPAASLFDAGSSTGDPPPEHPTLKGGPEVGAAELNSLADLFEHESSELDLDWQEESVGSEADLFTDGLELEDVNDFSDLLFDQDTSPPAAATASHDDDDDISALLNTVEQETNGRESEPSAADPNLDLLDDLSEDRTGAIATDAPADVSADWDTPSNQGTLDEDLPELGEFFDESTSDDTDWEAALSAADSDLFDEADGGGEEAESLDWSAALAEMAADPWDSVEGSDIASALDDYQIGGQANYQLSDQPDASSLVEQDISLQTQAEESLELDFDLESDFDLEATGEPGGDRDDADLSDLFGTATPDATAEDTAETPDDGADDLAASLFGDGDWSASSSAADDLSMDDLSGDDLSGDEPSTDDLFTGDSFTDDSSTDDWSADDWSADDPSVDELSTDDLSVDALSDGDLAVDELSGGDLFTDDPSIDDLPSEDASAGNLSLDDLPVDDLSVDDLPGEDASVDDLSLDDLPVDDLSVDDLPADSSPDDDAGDLADLFGDAGLSGDADWSDADASDESAVASEPDDGTPAVGLFDDDASDAAAAALFAGDDDLSDTENLFGDDSTASAADPFAGDRPVDDESLFGDSPAAVADPLDDRAADAADGFGDSAPDAEDLFGDATTDGLDRFDGEPVTDTENLFTDASASDDAANLFDEMDSLADLGAADETDPEANELDAFFESGAIAPETETDLEDGELDLSFLDEAASAVPDGDFGFDLGEADEPAPQLDLDWGTPEDSAEPEIGFDEQATAPGVDEEFSTDDDAAADLGFDWDEAALTPSVEEESLDAEFSAEEFPAGEFPAGEFPAEDSPVDAMGDLDALLDDLPASAPADTAEPVAAPAEATPTGAMDDLDALLSDAVIDPTDGFEPTTAGMDDLNTFFEGQAAVPEDAFPEEDAALFSPLAADQPDVSYGETEAIAEEGPATDAPASPAATNPTDDFADLDALLADDEANAATDVTASGAVAASATEQQVPASDIGAGDDFAELDALLDDGTELALDTDGETDEPDSESRSSADDDFADLEKLLEDADQTLGGAPASKASRGTPMAARRIVSRRGPMGDQTMRVSVKNLDNLNNLVGELVVNRNSLEQSQERLRQFLDNLLYQVQQLSDVGQRMRDLYERSLLESSLLSSRRSHQLTPQGPDMATADATHATGASFDALEMDRFTGFHTLSQEMIELIVRVRESASDIDFVVDESDQVTRMFRQVTTQLQEGLTRSRMVPFGQAADRLPRAVRDISIKCGKQAELVVEGRDTLIDKMILEQLYDPMTHLVNNAITHGIETPDERLAAGKPSVGKITIRTFHQGNQTVISVTDDGAGIDPERVKRKAIERGLITPQQAQEMSRLETYDLLFHQGFTTRDKPDNFAGRGVGMDVVLTSLNEIRGVINTDSTLGQGTTFTVRLPLTLSISKALLCVSNRARIAFPMDGVEDMLDVPKERIQTDDQGRSCILWRDILLPFRPLSDLLKFNRTLGRGSVYGGNQEDDVISMVVLRSAGNYLALQVDQVLGEQEIVIKQLEAPVPKPSGIAGATVLGDGRIMPIADVLELIDLAMGRIRREAGSSLWDQADGEEPVSSEPTVASEPTVLIVDDSITVRELLSMTFNKVGYRVEQARDGQEAWEKLRSGLPCDLVFCDIEMPRMDGLELLSRLQKDPALSTLPIAMLTSRGADRHRQMAIQLGAKGYFTKPYLEEALLDAAQRMLKGEVLVAGSN